MLICNVFSYEDGTFSNLIIQPEITDGRERIEIPLTKEEAEKIVDLQKRSNESE